MAKIEIYTTNTCPFCRRALALLAEKNVTYQRYDVSGDTHGRAAMTERAGGATSVPQIFIDDAHIGGCDALYALEEKGELDPLLS